MTRSLRCLARYFVAASTAFAALACGGNKPAEGPTNEAAAVDVDADPLALLPSGGIAYARVNFTNVRQDKAIADEVDTLAPSFLPAAAAEFVPSRDLNAAVCTAYSATGLDGLCVLTGTFKPEKVEAALLAHPWAHVGGQVLVKTVYQGKTLFTLANVGFTLLSPKTALAGNEGAIRRALDRIADRSADGRLARTIEPWALETLETKDADAVLVVNTESEAGKAAKQQLPVWLRDFRAVRAIGNVRADKVNVAVTFSFAEPAQAERAEKALSAGAKLYALGTMLGQAPSLSDFDVKTVGNDTQVRATLTTGDLSQALRKLPRQSR